MQSAHEGGKVVSPMYGRLYNLPKRYSWFSLLMEANPTPESHSRNNEVNEKFQWLHGGIEAATFRLVAQYLNQPRHCVLHPPLP